MIKDVEGIGCIRKDTADNFKNNNPILDDGEVACESDTGQFKMGDGKNKWNSLDYLKSRYLKEEWETLEPNKELLAGTFLIKVKINDKTSGVNNKTIFIDLISVSGKNFADIAYNHTEPPYGPLHFYNFRENFEQKYKTIRIKAYIINGGHSGIDLYISESSSTNGSIPFPNTLVKNLTTSEFEYVISYKRLM